jgi:hypothetical protein
MMQRSETASCAGVARWFGFLMLAAWLTIAVGRAHAPDLAPGAPLLDFAVERNNEQIGFHRIRFSRDGERLVVDTEVSIRVTALFVTVYRFSHRAREVWTGGRLVALDAETDDDGTPHRLSVRAEGGALHVMHNGDSSNVAAGLVPTSLWNKAATDQTVLLGTLRGDAMPTRVTRLGAERISGPEGELQADGFVIDASPDYKRWVWYDRTGRLVAVRLLGRDGSLVTYRLR